MKKLSLILAIIMLMLSTVTVSASALSQTVSVEDGSIVFDPLKGSISLSGTVGGARTNSYVFMKIYPSPASPSDPLDQTKLIAATSVFTAGDTFTFEDVVLPDDLESTECTIVLTSLYNSNKLVINNAFYYAAKASAKSIIQTLDAKTTVGEVDGILDVNYKNLSFVDYPDYNNTTSIAIALDDVVSETFPVATDAEFLESWDKLLTLLKRGTYAALLKDTESSDVTKRIVETDLVADALGLVRETPAPAFNAYQKSDAATKAILYNMLLSAEFNEPAQVPDVFTSMAAVAYIRNNTFEDVPTVFDSVSSLKATNYAYYNNLDPEEQTTVLKSVVNKAATALDVQSLITHFETYSETLSGPLPPPPGNLGGGGGGGGGGGNVLPKPPTTPLAPPVSVGQSNLPPIVFTDIADAFWAEAAIMNLAEKGILNGMGDGRFAPNQNITRAQICKIAVLAFGLDLGEIPATFDDVKEGAWYKQYVDILSSNGIINGYGGGNFNPEGAITREELAVILDRILTFKNDKPLITREFKGIADSEDINDYALQSVKNMYQYGILNGDGVNIRPRSLATRAETAQLINQMLIK